MRKIIGILVIAFALFWIWYYGRMVTDEILYSDDLIFCFRPPIWVSIFNSILGFLGLIIGIKIFKNSLKNLIALIILIIILLIGFLAENYGYLLM